MSDTVTKARYFELVNSLFCRSFWIFSAKLEALFTAVPQDLLSHSKKVESVHDALQVKVNLTEECSINHQLKINISTVITISTISSSVGFCPNILYRRNHGYFNLWGYQYNLFLDPFIINTLNTYSIVKIFQATIKVP